VVLSRYRPTVVLRGSGGGRRSGAIGFRQGLIVFQFVATLALLIGSMVVLLQMRYVEGKDLGFESESRILVHVPKGDDARARFRETASQSPAIRHVTYAMGGPTKNGRLSQTYTWDGVSLSEAQSLQTIPVDAEFVDTFGLRLIAGRALAPDDEVDPHGRVVLVNRSMTERMGFETPDAAVGAALRGEGGEGALGLLDIVGVVEDFHHGSLHNGIDPSVMLYWPRWTSWAGITLASAGGSAGIDAVEGAFEAVYPDTHFRYEFLDDQLAELYDDERRIASTLRMFTGLSVLIACLGLFGLAALTAAQRTREIGVRKVLGASAASIVALLSKEVVRLVGVALLVASPLAYIAMRRWLDGFAYRVDLGPVPFLVAGALVLVVALATVGGHALRAATADPVSALHAD
ncbi:ABC transporter permease, partial [Rubrivirga sp.]|uniref:ABC transporter permease n=1 Tax=Rubrivirga sp. TaxID=1885344 RepID=UPI003C7485C7